MSLQYAHIFSLGSIQVSGLCVYIYMLFQVCGLCCVCLLFCTFWYTSGTVHGIKKLSSTGAGTDTGTDTGAIDNT